MSRVLDSTHSEGAASARFRPAAIAGKPVHHAAGPFDIAAIDNQSSSFAGAVLTGLLVIYPAFATVAAIVVGLFLSGNGA